MLPYIRRSIWSQLCSFVLTVALLALPLAGTRIERAPILTPLATELVPLGASLQSPPTSLFHLPSLAAAGKLVLGPLSRTALAPNVDGNGRAQNITRPGCADSRATDQPNGRAPPSD
jgi:hypothetical protein